jgi:cyanate permease
MAPAKKDRIADMACIVAALIGGFVAGAVDFNNNDPRAAALVIVAVVGLLGFAQPRQAWRWAFIVGLGVPICI